MSAEMVRTFAPDQLVEVPEHLRGALSRYIVQGIPPGHFLTAVLEHELFQAFARADEESREGLAGLVSYLYNIAPMGCHGNPATVRAWCHLGGLSHHREYRAKGGAI